jgi:hypothetical protein
MHVGQTMQVKRKAGHAKGSHESTKPAGCQRVSMTESVSNSQQTAIA